MKEKIGTKQKAHTVYRLLSETRVPGTTTITGLLAKPFLITWANRLGLAGIDSTKYTDDKANIGTLAHYKISQYLLKKEVDINILNEYSKNDDDISNNCFNKFLEWEKRNKIEIIESEMSLVSEEYGFGGTIDFYGKINGIPTLLDLKTGKDIYDDMWFQIAGYSLLLKENKLAAEQFIILNINRDETEHFREEIKKDISIQIEIFKSLLNIYYNKKKLGRE